MSKKISRRDFLKLAGAGAAATAVLTGCGPASRYVNREPYTKMPEYTYNGKSTYYATTCRECAAGCGLVVRTMQGRAIKVEGNKLNPVNLGKTCARGQAALQGLYNPDRVQGPLKQPGRGSRDFTEMDWDAAVGVVAGAFKSYQPDEIAFLVGMAPDHLFDLVSDMAKAISGLAPVRYGALGMFEARATLMQAAEAVFGRRDLLHFDLAGAEVTFSFGANFMETWLSPVANTRGFAKMRQGMAGRRGYLVQFEPRMSQTAATADEWIPVAPGTEGLVALAIGSLVSEAAEGTVPPAYADVDLAAIAEKSGVPEETMRRLARIFANTSHALAIPGGSPLGQTNGLDAARAILALNVLADNLGQPGGVFINPPTPLGSNAQRPVSMREMSTLVQKMKNGKIKALFVHGVNPLFELPKALGFEAALVNVPLVVSFASFPDETAMQADFIFPDHTGLESWGYQRVLTGADVAVLSGAQPTVAPFYNTRATADVLLAAVRSVGGKLAAALPFEDEVAYLRHKLLDLVKADGGVYSAPEINTFSAQFQQYGGWWQKENSLGTIDSSRVFARSLSVAEPEYSGEGELHLFPFVSPILAESGANKPWLQEIPDPTTTVMWNTWVEMNPRTAEELGITDDDVVRITTPVGVVEAPVYRYPAIRPDTIAIPFGQGHTAYGRYAQGRGVNPIDLLSIMFNEAGDLAFAGMIVKVEKTGKRRELSRMEGRLGVYGLEEH
ncbi:MAG: molybdopterin-dependent oxidoreductase [Chloroflexi bacterium]|nr:molybdopterin-dependent oxidoreductase [Chloroflexota bacterium]